MYTDTSRPNHLAHEVIDNSVDEALAGYCKKIEVTLHTDGSVEVQDDGRGMPVDKHPKEKIPGVELILTRLHAGGKFNKDNYQYSGGLHGVGVSVVNALSKNLEVWIRRDAKEYNLSFAGGKKRGKLEVVGKVGKANTGTTIRFWPDPQYFDSAKISVPKLKHALKAKAVLCPGLTVRLKIAKPKEKVEWCYAGGLEEYLLEAMGKGEHLPAEPFGGSLAATHEAVDWALAWSGDGGQSVTESYVNLVPTPQGGTHVNGLRTGLTNAIREFCDFRNLLPRGVQIAPEDVWDGMNFVLSTKLEDPQFSGQTKERLSSRESAAFVSGVIKDEFALWLNQHPETGDADRAGWRYRQSAETSQGGQESRPQENRHGVRRCRASWPTARHRSRSSARSSSSRGIRPVAPRNRRGTATRRPSCRCAARSLIPGKWMPAEILGSQEVHDISVALGVDPGNPDLDNLRYHKICILADADSDGLHIATLLCALFLRHYRDLVLAGHVYVAMPPLYRIDVGKEVFYALDESESARAFSIASTPKKFSGKVSVTRFKGLGEMSPAQLRETTMNRDTRRLVQLTVNAKGQDRPADGHAAREKARQRPAQMAGREGQPRRSLRRRRSPNAESSSISRASNNRR